MELPQSQTEGYILRHGQISSLGQALDCYGRDLQIARGTRQPPWYIKEDSETNLLLLIQQTLNELLNNLFGQTTVAYGGSLSLYLQNKIQKYGDLDVFTNREYTREEISRLGIPINDRTSWGWQSWNINLDIFFCDNSNQSKIEIGEQYIKTLDNGIKVQDCQYVLNFNYVANKKCSKQRPTIPYDLDPTLIKEIEKII